jgi:hypothetical protein
MPNPLDLGRAGAENRKQSTIGEYGYPRNRIRSSAFLGDLKPSHAVGDNGFESKGHYVSALISRGNRCKTRK